LPSLVLDISDSAEPILSGSIRGGEAEDNWFSGNDHYHESSKVLDTDIVNMCKTIDSD